MDLYRIHLAVWVQYWVHIWNLAFHLFILLFSNEILIFVTNTQVYLLSGDRRSKGGNWREKRNQLFSSLSLFFSAHLGGNNFWRRICILYILSSQKPGKFFKNSCLNYNQNSAHKSSQLCIKNVFFIFPLFFWRYLGDQDKTITRRVADAIFNPFS